MAGLLVDTGCWILDDKDLFPLKKGGLRGLFSRDAPTYVDNFYVIPYTPIPLYLIPYIQNQ